MQKHLRQGIGVDRLLVTAALVVVCTTPLATASDVITACAKKNGTMHLIGELFDWQECKQHELRVEWGTGTEVNARVTLTLVPFALALLLAVSFSFPLLPAVFVFRFGAQAPASAASLQQEKPPYQRRF